MAASNSCGRTIRLSGADLISKFTSGGLSKTRDVTRTASGELIDEKVVENTEQTEIDLPDLSLPDELLNRMFPHQSEGVSWMFRLHMSRHHGGILGDDMGLGKTFQVTCLMTGLMRQETIRKVLIVAPVSVLQNWCRELNQHLAPHVNGVDVELISADQSKKKRQQILSRAAASRTGRMIIISSYALVSNMISDFADHIIWDYVILDEGHVIKNPATKQSKAMRSLPSLHRLLLTGTPIQNNLAEFWALIDWATQGKLLGTKADVTNEFSIPILAGLDPDASLIQKQTSECLAKKLMNLIQPILLQRKKCERQETLKLTTKEEIVIWIPLSTKQRAMYEKYINDRDVLSALTRATYPVEIINHLKTLSRHPFLLEASNAIKSRTKSNVVPTSSDKDKEDVDSLVDSLSKLSFQKISSSSSNKKHNEYHLASGDDVCQSEGDGELEDFGRHFDVTSESYASFSASDVFTIAGRTPDIHELLQGSVKLRVLLKLTKRLLRKAHRLLIFSQAKMQLDIIQRVFQESSISTCRIDGSVTGKDRQKVIDQFNNHTTGVDTDVPSVCLLTTRACGFGITLTGADRVIIFDPSWNPAEDRQAVDRAFRIGQTKNVVVYRMIMASSVEEKMYEKQVFKDGIRIVTESGGSSSRYFQGKSMSLFVLGDPDRSEVMEKIWEKTGCEMLEYEDCGGLLPGALGYSRHDNLYEEQRPDNIQNRCRDLLKKSIDRKSVTSLHDKSQKTLNNKKFAIESSKKTCVEKPVGIDPSIPRFPGMKNGIIVVDDSDNDEKDDVDKKTNEFIGKDDLISGEDNGGVFECNGNNLLQKNIDDCISQLESLDLKPLETRESHLQDEIISKNEINLQNENIGKNGYRDLTLSSPNFPTTPPHSTNKSSTINLLLSQGRIQMISSSKIGNRPFLDFSDDETGDSENKDVNELLQSKLSASSNDGRQGEKTREESIKNASSEALSTPSTISPLKMLFASSFQAFKKVKVPILTKEICGDPTRLMWEATIIRRRAAAPESLSAKATKDCCDLLKCLDLSFNPQRPWTQLNECDRKKYNCFVKQAQDFERMKDREGAAACYAAAFAITDYDPILHGKLRYLTAKNNEHKE